MLTILQYFSQRRVIFVTCYNIRMIGKLPAGTVHTTLPAEFKKALLGSKPALATWRDITPLARNEWLCWMSEAKQADTRARRMARAPIELAQGKRRPCCWIGCIHRTDKAISPSVRGILNSRSQK